MCKLYFLLIIILFSFFAQAQEQVEKLQNRWLSAFDFQISKTIEQKEPILLPKNAVILVAEIFLKTQGLTHTKDCLFYKVPASQSIHGELFVINLEMNQKCIEHKFKEEIIFEKKSIYNFAIKKEKKSMILYIDRQKIKFSYLNFNESQIIYSNIKSHFLLKSNLSDGEICFDVDDNCNVIKTNVCNQCQNNSIHIISSKCNKNTRMRCSSNRCGEAGSPACIRGQVASKYVGDYCIADSPVAFCIKPARVVCVNDELVCR